MKFVRVCGCFTPRQIKHAEDSTVRFSLTLLW